MNDTKDLSVINNLRLPLILGVVILHSDVMIYLYEDAYRLSGFVEFVRIFEYLLRLSVPTFFFRSGYLFFRSGLLTRSSYLGKLHRRCFTLLIPYLLWNFADLGLSWVKTLPLLAPYFHNVPDVFGSVGRMLAGFWAVPGETMPYNVPLWFLRDLIVVVLVSPLLSLGFKLVRGWILLPFLIFISVCQEYMFYGLPDALWYFCVGAFCALYFPSVESLTRRFYLWLGAFVILCICDYWEFFYLPFCLMRTAGVFVMLGLSRCFTLRFREWPPVLSHSVFFIYAIHGLYSALVVKLACGAVAPVESSWGAFVAYVLAIAMNFGLSFLFYLMFKRFLPGLTDVLTGRRA